MNEYEKRFQRIALHESGHAVAAWALGHEVTKISMIVADGAIIGLTHPRYRGQPLRRELIAVFEAGEVATSVFSHLRLPTPILSQLLAFSTPHNKPAKLSIDRFSAAKTAAQSGSEYDGDYGVVAGLLKEISDPIRREQVWRNGQRLCRLTLDSNERLLRDTAAYLCANGGLRGEVLQELAERVVRIDPRTYKPVPRVELCTL